MDAAARLWSWCGEVYRQPGVAAACLCLQDEYGADVNLALALVWAGAEGSAVDRAALGPLIDVSRRWQSAVVAPLRGARRALKTGAGAPTASAQALGEEVKTVEREAERLEQELLAAALPLPTAAAGRSALERASANLLTYLQALAKAGNPVAAAAVGAILAGAFPNARAEEIAAALAAAR